MDEQLIQPDHYEKGCFNLSQERTNEQFLPGYTTSSSLKRVSPDQNNQYLSGTNNELRIPGVTRLLDPNITVNYQNTYPKAVLPPFSKLLESNELFSSESTVNSNPDLLNQVPFPLITKSSYSNGIPTGSIVTLNTLEINKPRRHSHSIGIQDQDTRTGFVSKTNSYPYNLPYSLNQNFQAHPHTQKGSLDHPQLFSDDQSIQIKESHKLAERHRRRQMKELFDLLRSLLPVNKQAKPSKWEVLSQSIDHIHYLKKVNHQLYVELMNLRGQLQSQISSQAHPLPQHPPDQASKFNVSTKDL